MRSQQTSDGWVEYTWVVNVEDDEGDEDDQGMAASHLSDK
jgi:hypothetical protein